MCRVFCAHYEKCWTICTMKRWTKWDSLIQLARLDYLFLEHVAHAMQFQVKWPIGSLKHWRPNNLWDEAAIKFYQSFTTESLLWYSMRLNLICEQFKNLVRKNQRISDIRETKLHEYQWVLFCFIVFIINVINFYWFYVLRIPLSLEAQYEK